MGAGDIPGMRSKSDSSTSGEKNRVANRLDELMKAAIVQTNDDPMTSLRVLKARNDIIRERKKLHLRPERHVEATRCPECARPTKSCICVTEEDG